MTSSSREIDDRIDGLEYLVVCLVLIMCSRQSDALRRLM